jgi:hypothetical protein
MNEPKAWINIEDGLSFLDWDKSTEAQESYPLYVMNELTDEEIIEVYKKVIESYGHDFAYTYARAILKKAREK